MDRETYANNIIIDYVNKHFYAIKMDGEGKKDITFKNHTFKFKQEGKTKYHVPGYMDLKKKQNSMYRSTRI